MSKGGWSSSTPAATSSNDQRSQPVPIRCSNAAYVYGSHAASDGACRSGRAAAQRWTAMDASPLPQARSSTRSGLLLASISPFSSSADSPSASASSSTVSCGLR
eukprot:scaffold11050_cov116-Isochrysis_galbana.AAC.3